MVDLIRPSVQFLKGASSVFRKELEQEIGQTIQAMSSKTETVRPVKTTLLNSDSSDESEDNLLRDPKPNGKDTVLNSRSVFKKYNTSNLNKKTASASSPCSISFGFKIHHSSVLSRSCLKNGFKPLKSICTKRFS